MKNADNHKGAPNLVAGTGAQVRWQGINIVHAGTYKLCFCGALTDCPEGANGNCCVTDSEFNVEFGEIVVDGPTQGKLYYPIVGVPFNVKVTGGGLSQYCRGLFIFCRASLLLVCCILLWYSKMLFVLLLY